MSNARLKGHRGLRFACLLAALAFGSGNDFPDRAAPPDPREIRIGQLVQGQALFRRHAHALPSLLTQAAKQCAMPIESQPVMIESFEDPLLFRLPFIYINAADRADWSLTPTEQHHLRDYLERGGFIFIDAGINTEFLRDDQRHGQSHSFPDWEPSPEIRAAFHGVFPDKPFRPVDRGHRLFRSFYRGLPDPSVLPDSVRDYVIAEKWPEGTYSVIGIEVGNRLAVIATPIVSIGWGRDPLGNWTGNISFRIRESAAGLSERLSTASYAGQRFEATREDGRKDVIYCQVPARPAWVHEPDGRWRVFRYYQSREISDYAHAYFTRLGINILVFALTQ